MSDTRNFEQIISDGFYKASNMAFEASAEIADIYARNAKTDDEKVIAYSIACAIRKLVRDRNDRPNTP